METSGSSSTTSEQQLQRREGLNTKTDVAKQSLISSEEWLQLHGLRSNKLTLKQILSQIGFPHCEDYVASLGRFVASRYAEGLFPRVCRAEDGTAYNLTAKSELIYEFVEHLTQAVKSYKQRMDWLTSRSQQIFGVILEQCITIVLDFGDMREEELNLCQDALKMVLQEQVAHTAKFNIIWASQEPVKWQENAAPVMEQSIAAAISWVEKLTYEQALSPTSRLDALLEAGKDKTTESIYYFVVGDIPEESKQLLLQRALEIPCPVCTVSFNARGEDTIAFLKNLSARTHGRKLAIFALDEVPAGGKHKQIESISFVKGHWTRFHAFAERTECVEFPAFSLKDGDSVVTWNSRKLKGKLPPGAEVREDVFLIWREMEEACSTLAQIQRLMAKPSKSDVATIDCESGATSVGNESNPEDIWDSKKWLQKYGLKAQNLSFYDVLADCSFRHADGVVDIKAKPENEYIQTSAETNKKIVHAKYCSRFVHVPWKNGSLVHVCITKEKCTWYSEKIHAVLAQIQRRIKWLQDGSQILFGKVSNDCNYILIDTSHSMKGKLDLVKDKIIQFIQEQLKFKRKFNFVQFAAQAVAWRDKLVEINEDNLKGAQSWVRNMKTGSSTNTLTALKIAFADKETQAIYLLTDGRPDQPPEMVIDQVKVFQKIPIYTISFNYNDKIANGFLKELASLTGGEFHSYRFGFKDPCPPEAVQNEDLTLLIKEMEQGLSDLEKMQNLYSESLIMDWWYNGEKGDKHQKEICSLVSTPEKCADPHSDVEATQVSSQKRSKVPEDLSNQKIQKKKVLHAESTKTSLLRSQMSTLKSSACSKKDDFSNSSNWNTPSDREMSIPLTNEYPDDKSLERLTPRGSQVYDQDYSGMSSANWLKTHGLVARKLTIMDALSVTAVPHSPTYIPVLDKHVVSKVFDEVFPLAHVCNDTNRMTLINPQGVKLNIYKQNVEQAIKSYEKRLNKIVWRALSQEEKEKLDANKPMRYLENKAALNEALERLNWPISLKELSLLENEILAGKMYVQQAMELQEAARKENYVSRALAETLAIINPINNSIMDLLENFMWLLPDYRKLVWHLFGVSGQETAIHVHRSGWSPDSFFCSAERPNEASMQTLARSVRIIMDEMRHSHGLPSPVEEKGQHGFSLKGSKSLGPCHDWPLLGFSAHYMMVLIYYAQQQKFQGNSTKKIKSKKLDHLKGQKVIARCDENGFYFPGIVKKCISPTDALVGFRYGDTKVVPISFITPVGGAMPCPLLQVGDYVFAKIVIPNGFDFYVPAIVIAVPNQDVAEDKFYTVLKSNNRREFCPRSALIKISQNKYALSCSHIKSPPVQEDPKVENVDMRNSTFLIRPTKEAGTTDLRELRQENPRRKKKKPAKRLPLLEVVSSDSDDPFHGNRSQESFPKRHTKVGEGRHCLSLEHPETSLD